MARVTAVRAGDIFWYNDCPALDGVAPKRRPVVVVLCDDADGVPFEPFFVVATTTDPISDYDRIELPSLGENPHTSTGLPEPCSAVPRWFMPLYKNNLLAEDYIGRVSNVLLYALSDALDKRLDEPNSDPPPGDAEKLPE